MIYRDPFRVLVEAASRRNEAPDLNAMANDMGN